MKHLWVLPFVLAGSACWSTPPLEAPTQAEPGSGASASGFVVVEPPVAAPATAEGSGAPAADGSGNDVAEGSGVEPVHVFVQATPRQEELFAYAADALRAGSTDAGITALLTLGETPEPSETRARGMLVLSAVYADQGRHMEAVQVLEALRPATPPMAQLEFMIGLSQLESGDVSAAMVSLRTAMRIDSAYLPPYAELARVYRDHQRPADADEVLLLLERQLLRMGEQLDAALLPDEKVEILERVSEAQPGQHASQTAARALDDDDAQVVLLAAAALSRIGTAHALEALRAVVTEARTPEIVEMAAAAIAAIESREQPAP
jgi:hypothetical protein